MTNKNYNNHISKNTIGDRGSTALINVDTVDTFDTVDTVDTDDTVDTVDTVDCRKWVSRSTF